jgi:ATP-dependent protease HslVU (ClpYQ) peptidase subunit
MTCIVGVRQAGHTYLAAESLVVNNGVVVSRSANKVFQAGDYMIGVSGEHRLLTMAVTSRTTPSTDNLGSVYDLVDHLRRLVLEVDKWKPEDDSGPPCTPGHLLIASPAGLWHVCSGWSVVDAEEGRPVGVGSGRAFAEGAARALLEDGVPPPAALNRAVRIACMYDTRCGGEIREWRL